MCNLYSQRKPREELRGLFNVSHNRATEIEPQGSIFPGYMAPVVRRAEDGDLELVKLSWGFVLLRDGYAPKRVSFRGREPPCPSYVFEALGEIANVLRQGPFSKLSMQDRSAVTGGCGNHHQDCE